MELQTSWNREHDLNQPPGHHRKGDIMRKNIQRPSGGEAEKILEIHNDKEVVFSNQPFGNNFEHLEVFEKEARLHLLIAEQEAKGNSVKPQSKADFSGDAGGKGCLERNASTSELVRNLVVLKKIRVQRELASREKGVSLAFVNIASLHDLDSFERDILMLLFVFASSQNFKVMLENSIFEDHIYSWGIKAGIILSILEHDFINQIKYRRYFSTNANLIKNEIIIGNNERYDRSESVMEQIFGVHQRIVNFILGDDNIYTMDMNCIEHVRSNVSIDKLILSGTLKNDIIEQVSNYIKGTGRRSELKVASHFGYGTGMACLLYGPSGTGKTMLAHCLANYLNMSLLMVNADGRTTGASLEEIIKYAFKEARLTNSIIFFDECDDIFEAGTRDSRSLLIEIEKSDCIAIFATNKPIKLDPAMDRRIQLKVPFTLPGIKEREKIWQTQIPDSVKVDDGVDFQLLAEKYYFSGGLIKNAIIAAINAAISKSDNSVVLLTKEIIEKAADAQSHHVFQYDIHGESYKPNQSIDGLLLSVADKSRLHHFAACESSGILKKHGGGTLLITSAISSAIEGLEAVASASDRMIRKYALSQILNTDDEFKSLINPLTQQSMKPMELPFLPQSGHRGITVLFDDDGSFGKKLGDAEEKDEKLGQFLNLLDESGMHLYIVTTVEPKRVLPPGIRRVVHMSYPPETVQINCWQKNLNGHPGTQDRIFDLVEHYSLYPFQIASICQEARIRSLIQYGNDERMFMFVEEVINGHRENQPILFGKG